MTALYYKHGREIALILEAHTELKAEARTLLLTLAPDMFMGLFRNKELHINRAGVSRGIALLGNIKRNASPELGADIELLLARMDNGSLQRALGFSVR